MVTHNKKGNQEQILTAVAWVFFLVPLLMLMLALLIVTKGLFIFVLAFVWSGFYLIHHYLK